MSPNKKFWNFRLLANSKWKGEDMLQLENFNSSYLKVFHGSFLNNRVRNFQWRNKTYLSSTSLSRFTMSEKLKFVFVFIAFRPRLNEERFWRISASSADTRLGLGFATPSSGARVSYLADMWVAIAQKIASFRACKRIPVRYVPTTDNFIDRK